ncbi:MAG: CPBP family intramembrane metalloprotease [Oscillospiraceae bacterium]|jgi:membrane protease YdiL (CAAX protease family)|nr:CPBP family intramembrane metalloprotease [Oscillospiraceae bacterium]
MKKRAFPFPMRRYESVIGIIYIPFHAYFLPMLLYFILDAVGLRLAEPRMDLIYYGISALFLLCAMSSYWKATIRDLKKTVFRTIQAVFLGYACYFLANFIVDIVMSFFMDNLTNPNSAAVIDSVELNPNMMLVVTVLLAPIAEETMFRGALFGTLRKKSRFAAYAVSALLFAVYHLWGYLVGGWGADILVYALQYIPAGIALAWCYEYSGTLVAPVVLHALINLIATVTIVWR